jgi:hypothetical protein
MRRIIFFGILIMAVTSVYGQNLIGLKYSEIRKYMKENYRQMNYNAVVNNRFNYIKYTDNSDSQTILFFLTTDSVCKSVRLIIDSSLRSEKEEEFNLKFRKSGDKRWIETRNGKDYIIKLSEEGWSCTINIEPDK